MKNHQIRLIISISAVLTAPVLLNSCMTAPGSMYQNTNTTGLHARSTRPGMMVSGTVYRDENVKSLQPGMTEQQVVQLLGEEPTSRTQLQNDQYILQWIYSYGTSQGASGSRHLGIIFSGKGEMVKIQTITRIGQAL